MITKQSVHKKYSMVGWVFLVLLLVFLLVFGFFFLRKMQKNTSLTNNDSESSLSVEKSDPQGENNSTEENPSSFPGDTASKVPSEKYTETPNSRKTDTHTIPNTPVEIELPKPALGDVEKLPNYDELLRLNDLQRSYESLSTYLEELEEELQSNPSDKELQELIKEIEQELKDIAQERESILNGDI